MKTNKWIYTAALGLLLASCQSVETPMFSDEDAFVAFDSKTTSIAENAGKEVKIPVSLVASKALNVELSFTIDASAYTEAGTDAKAGVHYTLKNESNTLTFVEGGDLTQYIVIEPIDNNTFDGDVFFDIVLTLKDGSTVNLGAYYTTAVTLVDDDHPLKVAGILGKFRASAPSLFTNEEGVVHEWNCEFTSVPGDVNGVYITQILPDGVEYKSAYGKVSADKRSISIEGKQNIGTYGGSYDILLDFNANPNSAVATVGEGMITINAFVGAKAYAISDGSEAGWLFAVGPVTYTKVEE